MTLAGFLTYCIALFIAAAVPGPGIVALVARALGSGFNTTLPMAFGLILGDLVYLSAAVLGLAIIAQSFEIIFLLIKLAGAAYLAFLAYTFWTKGISLRAIEANKIDTPVASFISGLLVTLGNPKVMVFYLAILPSIVELSTIGFGDYLILVGLTFAVLLAVLVPYLALATRARALLQTPIALRRMSRIAATFLGGAALAIALRA